MPLVTTIDFAIVIVKILTIAGFTLNILGFIYLSYDYLNREQPIMRKFLMVATPVTMATIIYGSVGIWYYRTFYSQYPIVEFGGILLYAFTGFLIGAFDGSFITVDRLTAPLFEWRHAILGAIITFVSIWLGTASLLWTLNQPLEPAFISAGILTPIGAIFGGCWHFLYHVPAPIEKSLPFFSARGLIVGFITSVTFGFCIVVVVNAAFGVKPAQIFMWRNSLLPALQYGIAGAVTGAVASHFFDWASKLRDRRLGVVGIAITLVGFVFQLIEPFISLIQQFVR